MATGFVPRAVAVLAHATHPAALLEGNALREGLAGQLRVQGQLEHFHALRERGTLVVVPTHLSNLDPLLMGYLFSQMGLPPLLYGASAHLFSNPLISLFMHNLGAYKVDRLRQAALYKEVLKEFATCSLELGCHNIFFPGGTRSRSGVVEQHLKKGLLGTAVRAYVGNLQARRPQPNLYVVPCTLSYRLVLEAETLIEDHLKEVGQSRYIIDDDEFTKPSRLLAYLSHLVALGDRAIIHFCPPLDVFGNPVDREGRSLDAHGRVIDPRRFVLRDGHPVYDEQRDREYTNELGDAVARAYRRYTVVTATQVVAHAIFALLEERNPGLDLYRLLHTGGEAPSFELADVLARLERALAALRARTDGPLLDEDVVSLGAEALLEEALKRFGVYHSHPAAERRGDRVFHTDRKLLLYYRNRLQGYGA